MAHQFYLHWDGEEWWLLNAQFQRIKAFAGKRDRDSNVVHKEARGFIQSNIVEKGWTIAIKGPDWKPPMTHQECREAGCICHWVERVVPYSQTGEVYMEMDWVEPRCTLHGHLHES